MPMGADGSMIPLESATTPPGKLLGGGGCHGRPVGSARDVPPPRPTPPARETGPAVGGSQRLVRVTRWKAGAASSRAKRATLNFFGSCAPQKAPKPPESEPHTFHLTSACRASKPQPSLTAFPGQKESSKKKLARQKKVGVADSANGPMPGLSPFFFRLAKCPGPGVQTRARSPLFEIPPGQVG